MIHRLALPLLVLLSTPALAQEQQSRCAPFEQVQTMLAAEYHETVVAQAVMGEGEAMLVLFASPTGGTWTAVVVKHDGLGCLAAGGTDWQERNDPAPAVEEGL